MTVETRLLGPVELLLDGLAVPVERVQVRRLLALLARSPGQPRASAALVEELWPNELPKDPIAALRVVVSRLRAALRAEAGCLRGLASTVTLDIEADAVDIVRFERLADAASPGETTQHELRRLDVALSMWRGEPYSGATGPPSFDRDAAQLAELREMALSRRAELLVETGQTAQAVAFATPLVDDAPHDERRARALALALAAEGRRPDALRVLAKLRHSLRVEFGLSSSPDTAVVEQAILAIGPPSPTPLLPADLIDRARQLRGRDFVIADLVGALSAGRARLRCAVVVGEAGVGKTSVAAGVAAQTVNVRYVQYEREQPALSPLANAFGLAPVATATAGERHVRGAALGRELAVALERWAGSRPFLLILDDLQWAGDGDRAFLFEALGRDRLAKGSILALTRTPLDGDNSLRSLLDRLERRSDVRIVHLAGLDRQGARQMYAGRAGGTISAAAADDLFALTGGLPYLIRGLADAGVSPDAVEADSIPGAIRAITDARVADASNEDVELIELAAVLGATVDVELLVSAARRAPDDVTAILDRWIECGVLNVGDPLRFDHELTRVSLAARVGPSRRRLLHQRAALVSQQLGRDPLVVADHLLEAGTLTDGSAIPSLLRGAELANERGQFGRARRLLDRAAKLEPDPVRRLEIVARTAWSMECAGDRLGSDDLYDQVALEARLHRYRDVAARAALGGGAFGGVVGGNRRRLQRVLDALDDPPPDRRLRLELAAAAISELRATDRPLADDLVAKIGALEAEVDDEADEIVRWAVRLSEIGSGPVTPDQLDELGALDQAAIRSTEIATMLRVREMLTYGFLVNGRHDDAAEALRRFALAVNTNPWPRYLWTAGLFEAVMEDMSRGPIAAEALARRAMRVGRDLGVPDAANGYAMFQLSVAQRTGGLAPLEPLIRFAAESSQGVAAWWGVHAAALTAASRRDEAIESLHRFRSGVARGSRAFGPIGVSFAVAAAHDLGDGDTASWCTDQLGPWSGSILIAGAGAACFGPADAAIATALDVLGDPHAADLRSRARQLMVDAGAVAWLDSSS